MKLPRNFKNNILPPALLAVFAALVLFYVSGSREQSGLIFSFADRGWELLYGIRDTMVGFTMPLPSVFMAFIDYEPRRLALAVNISLLLLFFLAWNLGRLKGGRLSGALYSAVTALIIFSQSAPHDPEQVFFMLLISVYLNLEAAREAGPGIFASLLSGLALGCTLLFRSTLFLFPLVIISLDLLRSARPRKTLIKEAAVFLLGAYILLIPWMRLNYFATGQIVPFEFEKAACNIITGAEGSVFTMEGNPRELAGLSRDDSALKWAAARISTSPGAYFLAVIRRVWHILKMFPFAVPLALAALFYLRKKTDPLLAALPAYFILVHSFMSVEERYFYPLIYMLGFVTASGAGVFLSGGKAEPRLGSRTAYALFIPIIAFVLTVEYLVLAYPYRAAADHLSGVEAALKKNPDNTWLLMNQAEWLIGSKRTEEGLSVLRAAVKKAGRKRYSDSAAILRIIDSPSPPSGDVSGFDFRMNGLLFTALREIELGLNKQAALSLSAAHDEWCKTANMLRGTPYARDRAILEELRLKNTDFQDRYIFNTLLYWPPKRRAAILGRLPDLVRLSDKLLFLKFLSLPLETATDTAVLSSLAGNRRLMALIAPCDYATAGRQLVKALLPLPPGAFARRGGVSGAIFKLLENRETGLKLVEASFAAAPAGAEETGYLAAVLSTGSSSAAAKLYGLRPSPLYLALALKGMSAAAAALAMESVKERQDLLLDAAEIYSRQGGKNETALLVSCAVISPKTDASGLRRAALALQGVGRYQEAMAVISKAVAASPGAGFLLSDRGVLHLFLGNRKAAERDFLAALSLEPDFWQARLNLAALLSGSGRRAEAAAMYEQLLLRRDLPAAAREAIRLELSRT
ncbi:MAG: hypothetical protein Q7R35_04365 [Elusimicrobiota bacterium]|nr:hypothetical protein [Elusimicrobiota bacterium]